MNIVETELPGVVIIEPHVFGDARGFFVETWNARAFAQRGLDLKFVQDNHSKSAQGTLRGLHYQIKQPQGKLVRVTAGEVFDVVVDIRKSSPTFGKWFGVVLSAENKRMLWVPVGFAHGFYVTSESAEFMYKCTDYYALEYERSIIWDDSDLAVTWPLVSEQQPLLSAKDLNGVSFRVAELFD